MLSGAGASIKRVLRRRTLSVAAQASFQLDVEFPVALALGSRLPRVAGLLPDRGWTAPRTESESQGKEHWACSSRISKPPFGSTQPPMPDQRGWGSRDGPPGAPSLMSSRSGRSRCPGSGREHDLSADGSGPGETECF
jgi:hypothetical protein